MRLSNMIQLSEEMGPSGIPDGPMTHCGSSEAPTIESYRRALGGSTWGTSNSGRGREKAPYFGVAVAR